MGNHIRITAIVGSYRKDGIIDTVIGEILASAREEGPPFGKETGFQQPHAGDIAFELLLMQALTNMRQYQEG